MPGIPNPLRRKLLTGFGGVITTDYIPATDLQTILQKALTDNYKVTLLPGTYSISGPLTLKSYHTLAGETRTGTVLSSDQDLSAIILSTDGNYAEQIRIENLRLLLTTGTGIRLQADKTALYLKAEALQILNVPANKQGFYLTQGASGCIYSGFRDIVISGVANNNGSTGFYAYPTFNTNILDNVTVMTMATGFYFRGAGANILLSCSAEGCGVGVFLSSGVINMAIHTMYFEGNITADIKIAPEGAAATQVVIIENCFFNGTSTAGYGVYISGAEVKMVIIRNCVFRNHTVAGIYVASTVTGPIIEEDNDFTDETTPVSDTGGKLLRLGSKSLGAADSGGAGYKLIRVPN